uniref:Nuclear receptor 2C2-associated protein n=1 Tax=Neogobius melanostomus TaxID=47308 RepID=A0A8C6T701_9GOBI
MASSLICRETQSRVSSVLNRDVNEETCWNSDQGEYQWVSLQFPQPVKISEIKFQFQGGFAAKACRLEGSLQDGEFKGISQFYPEDDNSLQISFWISSLEAPVVDKVKIIFENSTDFFGRIIVYTLDILGEKTP